MSDEPPKRPLFLKPEVDEPEVVAAEAPVVEPVVAAEPTAPGQPDEVVDVVEVVEAPARPVVRRPAPAATSAAPRPARPARAGREPIVVNPSTRPEHVPRELPHWWWMGAVVEATFVIVLLADWLTGFADPPANCSRSVCSLGQGVAILSLFGALLLGLVLVISMLVIAVGVAQGNRRVRGGRQ